MMWSLLIINVYTLKSCPQPHTPASSPYATSSFSSSNDIMFKSGAAAAGTIICVFIIYLDVAYGQGHECGTSWCGTIRISNPFRLKDDPPHCGNPELQLSCESNRTILHLTLGDYYVHDINYTNSTLRFVDATITKYASCSIPPRSYVPYPNPCGWFESSPHSIALLNCSQPHNYYSSYSSGYYSVNTSACLATNRYFFALDAVLALASDISESCVVEAMVPVPFPVASIKDELSLVNINRWLLNGFQVSYAEFANPCETYSSWWDFYWSVFDIGYAFCNMLTVDFWKRSLYKYKEPLIFFCTIIGWFFLRTLLGVSCLIAIVVQKWRKRHLSADDSIEEFLRNHNNLMPIKYSYSDIKKITQDFKYKLGQGGFGSVFKGKLRSGHSVAVKVLLSKSKANGQDFINEVASIGRTHHVNVVKLVGYCIEGPKQALVYDFMPNGSLDKLLFSERKKGFPVSWGRMHEIALGVARGMEYLHRGCEMQILHFDIKPHNILLDENFMPKISDFGLAKLYSVDDNIVSLTAVRGTLGYMAPELFYKNIGGVSFKADVYSFGMLLMEMVGRRKNLNVFGEDKFDEEEFMMELGDAKEDEKTIAKKIILVASWCIQMNPVHRPTMNKVVEMLECDDVELLQMPPKPCVNPDEDHLAMELQHSCNAIDTISLYGR